MYDTSRESHQDPALYFVRSFGLRRLCPQAERLLVYYLRLYLPPRPAARALRGPRQRL